MRVLFVSNYPHLPDIHGGLQTTTHDLCLAIQAMGAAAGVLCGRQASGPDAWQKDSTLGYPVWRATQPEHALAEVAARWQASAIVWGGVSFETKRQRQKVEKFAAESQT